MTRSSRRSTSKDVARAAGVSRTTVSFVLNNRPGQSIPEETRRRVLDAARRLDYRPHASARTLAAGRSDLVLLSIPDTRLGPGTSRFVEELTAALAEHGLTLITHLAGANDRLLPDVCATVNASAVVGLSPFDAETAEALHRAGAEVVLPRPDPRVGVGDAMELVGRLQADHLIGLGHRLLGYALPVHPGQRAMADARLAGVTSACAAAGIAAPVVEEIDLEITGASRAVTQWRSSGVTGVCAYNDETAIAVLAGLREQGITAPGGLAVVGVDDIPTAKLAAPPLSTISFDVHEAGRRRAEAIVAALRGQEEAEPSFDAGGPLLVRRSST